MTPDLQSLLSRALEVTRAATKGPWFWRFGGKDRETDDVCHLDGDGIYDVITRDSGSYGPDVPTCEAIIAWRALAEPLLRVAMAAQDFDASMKGSRGAILGGLSFGKLETLRIALANLSETRF